MTLLQRLRDWDEHRFGLFDLSRVERAAVVALIETAQVTVREFEAGNPFVGYSVEALEAAVVVFTEDKP